MKIKYIFWYFIHPNFLFTMKKKKLMEALFEIIASYLG